MTPIYCMTVQMNRSCIFLPFVLVITPCMYVEICKSINFCCRLWIELNHHNFIQCFVLFLMLFLILRRHYSEARKKFIKKLFFVVFLTLQQVFMRNSSKVPFYNQGSAYALNIRDVTLS